MAPISMMQMLVKTREAGFAALLTSGVMGVGALHAQTLATPGAEEEVRWTLPPPPRSLTAPAPVAPASAPVRAEAPNPFGGAPVMQQAAPAPMEQPSFLAPSAMPPASMQPPVSAQAPAPLAPAAPAAPVMAPPIPAMAATPVAAPPPAEPAPAPPPKQAAPRQDAKQPAAKQQAEKAPVAAKPATKAKPEAKVAAKPSPKPADNPTDGKAAKAKDGKPARIAAQPVPAPRPAYVPPPPSMLEKEPEESRIPVISTVMDGMSSVTKTIGGLFE